MTCTEARAGMLVAEPDELRGAGDTAVAEHIRGCASCATAARTIIEMNMRMADALRQITQDAASRHESAELPSHTAAVVLPWKRERKPGRASAFMAAAAVVCIAIAGATLYRQVARNAGDAYPLHIPERQALAAPVVNTTGTGAVAVIRTNNSKITVVWYLQPNRGKL